MTKSECQATGSANPCTLLPDSTFPGRAYQGCPSDISSCCYEQRNSSSKCQIPQYTLDTFPHTVFEEAEKQFKNGRENVPQILLLVTDGNFNPTGIEKAFNRSTELKNNNVTVIALAIGSVNMTNLLHVVSDGRVYLATDFTGLDDLLGDVLNGTCQVVRDYVGPVSPSSSSSDSNMLIIVIVIVVGILLLVAAAIAFYFCRQKNGKPLATVVPPNEDRRDSEKGMEMVVNPLFLDHHAKLQNRLAETESKLSTVARSGGSDAHIQREKPLPDFLR